MTGRLCDECVDVAKRFNKASNSCVSASPALSVPSSCPPTSAHCWGLGHCKTLDGRLVDMPASCEHTLLHTFCAGKPETTLQAQMEPVAALDTTGQAAGSASHWSGLKRVAVQESVNGTLGDIVEVYVQPQGSAALGVIINGSEMVSEWRTVAFGQGTVLMGPSLVTVRLGASGLLVEVSLRSQALGLLDIRVQVRDGSVTCGCSEGLFGFHDGQQNTEFLLPRAAYRSSADLPVISLADFANGSVPLPGSSPAMASFAEQWLIRSPSQRLFSVAAPLSCAVSSFQTAAVQCTGTADAAACCANMLGDAEVAGCAADFTALRLCAVRDLFNNSCAANCSHLNVTCVAGACVSEPIGKHGIGDCLALLFCCCCCCCCCGVAVATVVVLLLLLLWCC